MWTPCGAVHLPTLSSIYLTFPPLIPVGSILANTMFSTVIRLCLVDAILIVTAQVFKFFRQMSAGCGEYDHRGLELEPLAF